MGAVNCVFRIIFWRPEIRAVDEIQIPVADLFPNLIDFAAFLLEKGNLLTVPRAVRNFVHDYADGHGEEYPESAAPVRGLSPPKGCWPRCPEYTWRDLRFPPAVRQFRDRSARARKNRS